MLKNEMIDGFEYNNVIVDVIESNDDAIESISDFLNLMNSIWNSKLDKIRVT